MSTARVDYPMVNHPDMPIFKPTLESLAEQTFRDFELIVVDHLIDSRPHCLEKQNFSIKHIRPKKSMWDDMRYPALANGYNTGIVHSNGEAVLVIGDCCRFEPDYLQMMWDLYKSGLTASSHVTFEDNRKYERRSGDVPGRLMWGYTIYDIKKLFEVNGFDQSYDGAKWCEDADLGRRLELVKCKCCIPSEVKVFEYAHCPVFNPNKLSCQPEFLYNDQNYNYLNGKEVKDNHWYYTEIMINRHDSKVNIGGMDEGIYRRLLKYDLKLCKLYITKPECFNLKSLWKDRVKNQIG